MLGGTKSILATQRCTMHTKMWVIFIAGLFLLSACGGRTPSVSYDGSVDAFEEDASVETMIFERYCDYERGCHWESFSAAYSDLADCIVSTARDYDAVTDSGQTCASKWLAYHDCLGGLDCDSFSCGAELEEYRQACGGA